MTGLVHQFALAGPDADQCRQAAQSSQGACKAAGAGLNAGDRARSAAAGAAAGQDINRNSAALQSQISQQRSAIGQARTACQTALQQCQQRCDQAKQSAQAKLSNPATRAMADADLKQIPGIKSSQCEAPIQQEIARQNTADAGLGGDSQQAGQTEQASDGKGQGNNGQGGMPPMQPPQQGQGDQGGEQAQTPPQQPGGINCGNADATRYSDCNDFFVSRCGNDMTSAGCEAFSERYCGFAQTSAVPAPGATLTKGFGQLVIDKSGEGLGSSFCKKANAHKFCSAGGRGHCPSCLGLNASQSAGCRANPEACMAENSPEMVERARNQCPMDPMFLDPAVQKPTGDKSGVITSFSTQAQDDDISAGATDRVATQAAGASDSGSGGFNPRFDEANAGGRAGEGASAESYGGGIRGFDSAGTGSAGGSSSSATSSEGLAPIPEFKLASFDNAKTARMPAAAVAGGAADVSNQFGPSVFSISTGIYKQLCDRGRLKNCGR